MDDVVGVLIVIGAVLSVVISGQIEAARDRKADERIRKMLAGELPYQHLYIPEEYQRADRW